MQYRCEATSVEGFVQQVAVQYLRHGYWFYVAGSFPNGKDPRTVDRKLIAKYGITASSKERTRRKHEGLANMHYIRHDRFFLIMATHGRHRFFDDEAGQIRDARRQPIMFAGYAISHRNGHSCVRIEQREYQQLKAWLRQLAPQRSVAALAGAFTAVRYVPYAPVRQQLLATWRAITRSRKLAGYEPLPIDCVPWRRKIVKPFGKPYSANYAKESAMKDSLTGERILVNNDGDAGPYIIVQSERIGDVRNFLDQNRHAYNIDQDAVTSDAGSSDAVFNFGVGADIDEIQRLLDDVE